MKSDQRDGSAGKGTRYQAWRPEFSSQDSHISLSHEHMPYMHICIHMLHIPILQNSVPWPIDLPKPPSATVHFPSPCDVSLGCWLDTFQGFNILIPQTWEHIILCGREHSSEVKLRLLTIERLPRIIWGCWRGLEAEGTEQPGKQRPEQKPPWAQKHRLPGQGKGFCLGRLEGSQSDRPSLTSQT